MKTKLFIIIFLMSLGNLIAQTSKSFPFKVGDTNLGGYLALNGKYTNVSTNSAGMLEFRGAIVFESGWAVGLNASGLSYDKTLSGIVNDGTYHLEAGYVGMYVEKIFDITDDLKISASILMGTGLTKYRYDKDFRKDKVWYEETIDETTFHITEPALEINYRIAGNWWIGLNGSYRATSPIEMIETDEDILRNFGAGLTFKYGVF